MVDFGTPRVLLFNTAFTNYFLFFFFWPNFDFKSAKYSKFLIFFQLFYKKMVNDAN
jgi:hypothetical protein